MSIPYVIEPGPNQSERVYDIYSRMLKDRIIFIRGVFNNEMADAVVGQLLFLEATDSEKEIYMYINSPGGEIDSMYAIYDTMCYVKPDIVTIGYGHVMSAASFILAAGTKGKRFALPNSDIMIHEMSTGNKGKYHELINYNDHMIRSYKKFIQFMVKFTGQPEEKITEDMKKDYFMSAEEAVEYGLIDKVQYNRE